MKEAASILGIEPGTVSRTRAIRTNGQTRHEKRLSKLSVLRYKQAREERDIEKDRLELQRDARRIPRVH